MLSSKLMVCLIGAYMWLMIITAWERNYALSAYWLGAVILNIAVLLMAYSGEG